ncbi:MAG TPA: hypothetical protein VF463_00675 [Sphingobium sp.]
MLETCPEGYDRCVGETKHSASTPQRGFKVIGATLLPFEGVSHYSTEKQAVWTAVDNWIRTSGEYDGVLDFAAVMASLTDPLTMNPAYDSQDNLYPGNAGYRTMGDAVDLSLFR